MKRIITALCLLMLFVAYQASVTVFTHVHYINGVLITHSHPFHHQHSHSSTSLMVIGLLSHFSSDGPEADEIQRPVRPLLLVLEEAIDTPISKEQVYRMMLLRAPPPLVPLSFKIGFGVIP